MDAAEPLERAYREEATQIRAALAARTGDVGLAEDAVQDAFVEAMEHWPRDGVPPNPGGWLATTARRKALDRLRRDKAGAEKVALLAAADGPLGPGQAGPVADPADGPSAGAGVGIGGPGGADRRADDELLSLVFACCDPAPYSGVCGDGSAGVSMISSTYFTSGSLVFAVPASGTLSPHSTNGEQRNPTGTTRRSG